MRCTLKCENPQDIEYTITMTATCEYWEKLKDCLDGSYNALEFKAKLHEILHQAHDTYWAKETDT